MITQPTVLILGAGASMHLGYPSGNVLVQNIIDNFDGTTISRNTEIESFGLNDKDRTEFANALGQSMLGSIDAFLEHRPELMNTGKFAIAQALIPREEQQKLTARSENWYQYLCNKLNTDKNNYARNNLSIITFNYDRSLDICLFNAIKQTYNLDDSDTYRIYVSIPIIHVHGKLGPLPFEPGGGREYGPVNNPRQIAKSSESIKIVHESFDQKIEFAKARKCIHHAEKIVFLGFGYHPVNMDRLDIPFGKIKSIVGTSYGFTDLEITEIRKQYPELKLPNSQYNVLDFLRNEISL